MTETASFIQDLIDRLKNPHKSNPKDMEDYHNIRGMIFMAWRCDKIITEERIYLRRYLNQRFNLQGFPL